jgi:four helix bundle protein
MNSKVTEIKNYIKEVEDLQVFKISYSAALEIHKLTIGFPKIEQYELCSQMRRASKSICSNLAEGFAKQSQSKAEFKRFITMCIGSAKEMDIWLNFCFDLGYVSKETQLKMKNEYLTISRMLQKLRNNIK